MRLCKLIQCLAAISTLVLPQSATSQTIDLRGTVTDPQGTPIPNAAVQLLGIGLATQTDPAGRFALSAAAVRQGTTAGRQGYRLAMHRKGLRLTLDAARAVRIEFFDLQGRRTARAVAGTFSAGTHYIAVQSQNGAARIGFLRFRIGDVETVYKTAMIGELCFMRTHHEQRPVLSKALAAIDTIRVSADAFESQFRPVQTWSDTFSFQLVRQQSPSASISLSATALLPASGLGRRASTAGIESFKIYVTDIRLHADVIMNGSGWQGAAGQLPLFSGVPSAVPYDSFDAAQARLTDTGYIDFMSSASLAGLTTATPVEEAQIADYNYISVSFMQPFKIKGAIPAITGETYYTKDGEVGQDQYGNWVNLSTTSLAQEPAEEGVVRMNNGGTIFKLLRPLQVTAQDVADATVFNVKMLFNPEGFMYGFNGRSAWGLPGGFEDTAGLRIYVPGLDVTAVGYREGETVLVERYLIDVNDSANANTPRNFDIRLDLFTLAQDSTNVYGVSIRGLVDENEQVPGSPSYVFFAQERGDTLQFQNWDSTAIIDNFIRLENIDDTGTADCFYENSGVIGASYTLIDKQPLR